MPAGFLFYDRENRDHRWWMFDKEAAHESLFSAFRLVRERDSGRLEDYKRFIRIYENRDTAGFSSYDYNRSRSNANAMFNVTKSVVDTVASRIGRTRPHARFQTVAGNYTLKRRGKLLERWVEAEQHRSGLDEESRNVFIDCAVTGTGLIKTVRRGKKPHMERVFPAEVFVDQVEALEGRPQQMFHRRLVARATLAALYPKYKQELEKLKPEVSYEDGDYGRDSLADQLEVVEAWRTPSSDGAGDGSHIIAVDGITLLMEKWTLPYHPITAIHWTKPRRGFWGIGLVEELMGLHIELNRHLDKIHKSLKFGSVQTWMDQASQVQGQKLTNEIGAINLYRGTPPIFSAPATVNPEVFAHVDRIYSMAFEKGGISRMSATGRNQLGADASGIAIREMHDIETERFALISTDWERFHMEVTEKLVDVGRDLASRIKDYTVVAARDRFSIAQVKWADVDMDKDNYVLRVAAASGLPSSPGARKQYITDLLGMGMLDPVTASRLLDLPDIDEHASLDRAVSDNLDRIIEKIIDEGKYEAPEPFQDHQLALKKFQAAYHRAILDGVPEDRLSLLRRYQVATDTFIQRAAIAQQQQALAAGPGTPPPPGITGQSPTAVTPQDGQAPF